MHQILHLMDTRPELANDDDLRDPKQFLIEVHQNKFSQFIPLRASLVQDISSINSHPDLPSFCLLADGTGLEDLEFASKILKPWEILVDLGPNCTQSYEFLLKTLSEFKGMDEVTMAGVLVHLAMHYESKEDLISKILCNTFESNKDGAGEKIKKEPDDKKGNVISWNLDNLNKAFKELFSGLNWNKVFESFNRIQAEDMPPSLLERGFDQKQFMMLFQIMHKIKIQNANFNINTVFDNKWACPQLQFAFIHQLIQVQSLKKDFLKCIAVSRLPNKVGSLTDLVIDSKVSKDDIEVW